MKENNFIRKIDLASSQEKNESEVTRVFHISKNGEVAEYVSGVLQMGNSKSFDIIEKIKDADLGFGSGRTAQIIINLNGGIDEITESGARKLGGAKKNRPHVFTGKKEFEVNIDSNVSVEDKNLKDFKINSSFGKIEAPEDLKTSMLGDGVIERKFESVQDRDIYINLKKLQGTLLETHGSNIFRGIQGRLTVLAKIGEGYLPFFASSSGASGKRAGAWYPFFGSVKNWLVKGSVNKDTGEMNYSGKIDEVTNLLNRNLVFPAKYIDNNGALGNQLDPKTNCYKKVIFDLNSVLKYQKPDYGYENFDDLEYTRKMTGYHPNETVNRRNSQPWIDEITKKIG